MISDIKAPKNRKRLLKNCIIVVVFLLVLQFLIHYTYKTRNPLVAQNKKLFQSLTNDSGNEDADKPAMSNQSDIWEKISWEDKKFVAYEERRRGPGEQGKFFNLSDPKDIQENEKWHRKEGFYVIVSDKMSVDRSLPEQRPEA